MHAQKKSTFIKIQTFNLWHLETLKLNIIFFFLDFTPYFNLPKLNAQCKSYVHSNDTIIVQNTDDKVRLAKTFLTKMSSPTRPNRSTFLPYIVTLGIIYCFYIYRWKITIFMIMRMQSDASVPVEKSPEFWSKRIFHRDGRGFFLSNHTVVDNAQTAITVLLNQIRIWHTHVYNIPVGFRFYDPSRARQ